jgi:hypothetical protein
MSAVSCCNTSPVFSSNCACLRYSPRIVVFFQVDLSRYPSALFSLYSTRVGFFTIKHSHCQDAQIELAYPASNWLAKLQVRLFCVQSLSQNAGMTERVASITRRRKNREFETANHR